MVANNVHSFQNPTPIMSRLSLRDTRDCRFLSAEQMLERGAIYREAAATHAVPVATSHDLVTRDKTVKRKPCHMASLSPIED